jgi:hypothetical protein
MTCWCDQCDEAYPMEESAILVAAGSVRDPSVQRIWVICSDCLADLLYQARAAGEDHLKEFLAKWMMIL